MSAVVGLFTMPRLAGRPLRLGPPTRRLRGRVGMGEAECVGSHPGERMDGPL